MCHFASEIIHKPELLQFIHNGWIDLFLNISGHLFASVLQAKLPSRTHSTVTYLFKECNVLAFFTAV